MINKILSFIASSVISCSLNIKNDMNPSNIESLIPTTLKSLIKSYVIDKAQMVYKMISNDTNKKDISGLTLLDFKKLYNIIESIKQTTKNNFDENNQNTNDFLSVLSNQIT